jgi:hypothetical protein
MLKARLSSCMLPYFLTDISNVIKIKCKATCITIIIRSDDHDDLNNLEARYAYETSKMVSLMNMNRVKLQNC